jgi:hypothetical protein
VLWLVSAHFAEPVTPKMCFAVKRIVEYPCGMRTITRRSVLRAGCIFTMCSAGDSSMAQVLLSQIGKVHETVNRETSAFTRRVARSFSPAFEAEVDALISELKVGPQTGSDLLAKLDFLYLFRAETEEAATSNLLRPDWTLKVNGRVVHRPGLGFQGDGKTGSIGISFRATNRSIRWGRDSACAFFHVFAPSGNDNGFYLTLPPPLEGAMGSLGRRRAEAGFWLANKEGARVGVYRDGALERAPELGAEPGPGAELHLFRDTSQRFSDFGLSLVGGGGGFSPAESGDLFSVLSDFATRSLPWSQFDLEVGDGSSNQP